MTSNATLLDDRRLELLKRHRIRPTFSLDGIGASHDRHRKTIDSQGSFRFIEENIARLLQLPDAIIRLTVTPETAPELDTSVRWLVEQGFQQISISPVIEAEWRVESLQDYYDAWNRVYEYQAELLRQRPDTRRITNIFKMSANLRSSGKREWGCGAARNMVAIDASGDLFPCHRFVGYSKAGFDATIGTIFDGFRDSRRHRYIGANRIDAHSGCGSGLFDQDVPTEQRACGSCSFAGVCGSACMAVNEHMTGDPRRPADIHRLLSQIHTAVHIQNLYPELYAETGGEDGSICSMP